MSNLSYATSASNETMFRNSEPFAKAVKSVLRFWLDHHPPVSQNLRNLGEQLCAELENTYPTVDSTEHSLAERALQEDHQPANQHNPASDTPASSRANQSPAPSSALEEFRNHLTAAHLERASSPDIFDMPGEEPETPNSDKRYDPPDNLLDYVSPVGLRNWVPRSEVHWYDSPTACSFDSETPEEPVPKCQPEAPDWVKRLL